MLILGLSHVSTPSLKPCADPENFPVGGGGSSRGIILVNLLDLSAFETFEISEEGGLDPLDPRM